MVGRVVSEHEDELLEVFVLLYSQTSRFYQTRRSNWELSDVFFLFHPPFFGFEIRKNSMFMIDRTPEL